MSHFCQQQAAGEAEEGVPKRDKAAEQRRRSKNRLRANTSFLG